MTYCMTYWLKDWLKHAPVVPVRLYVGICILMASLFLPVVVLACPAQAETWVMVAKSDTTQEVQYVDADSILVVQKDADRMESNGSIIRLRTYWGFLDQPQSMSYATTEYRCNTAEYRDAVVNGESTGDNWHPIGDDPLNRAAMDYGCKRAANSKTATP